MPTGSALAYALLLGSMVLITACAEIVGADFGDYTARTSASGGGSGPGGAAGPGSGGSTAATDAGEDATSGGRGSGAAPDSGADSGSGGMQGAGGSSGTGGAPGSPPSCEELPTTCGPSANEDCCATLLVTGGTFYRSYDGVTAAYMSQSYPAAVSDFRLDRFEVTVGRFRKFRDAWNSGWQPAAGAGKHTHLNGGSGLSNSSGVTTYESGWATTWSGSVATPQCPLTYQTWTAATGPNETLPVNCINWYEAAAFCIWDGGFLPSEAESSYAAAGGDQQRVYPWSSPPGSTTLDCSFANHGGPSFPSTACVAPGTGFPNGVGSESPRGDGRYGQADLGGNLFEWALDWYLTPQKPACDNCAYLPPSAGARVVRGGSFNTPAASQLTSYRYHSAVVGPSYRSFAFGARCARAP